MAGQRTYSVSAIFAVVVDEKLSLIESQLDWKENAATERFVPCQVKRGLCAHATDVTCTDLRRSSLRDCYTTTTQH